MKSNTVQFGSSVSDKTKSIFTSSTQFRPKLNFELPVQYFCAPAKFLIKKVLLVIPRATGARA